MPYYSSIPLHFNLQMHTFDSSLYFCFHKFKLPLHFDLLNDLFVQFRKISRKKRGTVLSKWTTYTIDF